MAAATLAANLAGVWSSVVTNTTAPIRSRRQPLRSSSRCHRHHSSHCEHHVRTISAAATTTTATPSATAAPHVSEPARTTPSASPWQPPSSIFITSPTVAHLIGTTVRSHGSHHRSAIVNREHHASSSQNIKRAPAATICNNVVGSNTHQWSPSRPVGPPWATTLIAGTMPSHHRAVSCAVKGERRKEQQTLVWREKVHSTPRVRLLLDSQTGQLVNWSTGQSQQSTLVKTAKMVK